MGLLFGVICKECGEKYVASEPKGTIFYILHCDICGKGKPIRVTQVEETISAYPNQIKNPNLFRILYLNQIPFADYLEDYTNFNKSHIKLELLSIKCNCGGYFRFNAPNRCPKCRSSEYRKDPTGPIIEY